MKTVVQEDVCVIKRARVIYSRLYIRMEIVAPFRSPLNVCLNKFSKILYAYKHAGRGYF